MCDGLDDNCNGSIDEGFACVQRGTATRACTGSCGETGTESCNALCAWDRCVLQTRWSFDPNGAAGHPCGARNPAGEWCLGSAVGCYFLASAGDATITAGPHRAVFQTDAATSGGTARYEVYDVDAFTVLGTATVAYPTTTATIAFTAPAGCHRVSLRAYSVTSTVCFAAGTTIAIGP